MLYSVSLLVIHFVYSSVYMSIPVSQTIPSSQSSQQPQVLSLLMYFLSLSLHPFLTIIAMMRLRLSSLNQGRQGPNCCVLCTAGQGHFLPESPLGLSIMSCMESKLLSIESKLRYKYHAWASLVAQLIQNPPAMQEALIRFLGQKDPLEKG